MSLATPITWHIDNYGINLHTSNLFNTGDCNKVRVEINGFIEHNKDYLKLFNDDVLISTYTGIISETLTVTDPKNLTVIFTSDATNSTGTGITVTVSDIGTSGTCFSGINSIDELLMLPTKDVFEYIVDKLCSIDTPSNGRSAYQIARDNGYIGSELEWIDSLKVQGDSAYKAATDNGFSGSEIDWLLSLKGEVGQQGSSGNDGKDAVLDYDILLNQLLNDTAFLDSLIVTVTEHVATKVIVSINKPNVTCVSVQSHTNISTVCGSNTNVQVVSDTIKDTINRDTILLKIQEVTG